MKLLKVKVNLTSLFDATPDYAIPTGAVGALLILREVASSERTRAVIASSGDGPCHRSESGAFPVPVG